MTEENAMERLTMVVATDVPGLLAPRRHGIYLKGNRQ